MTRRIMWLQSGTYAASSDRDLPGALWPSPASAGCQVAAAGTGMDVTIAPGQVAVPSANNTGSSLCTSTAVETLTLDPAPPTGTDRRDNIICRPRSVDLDGTSTDEDFIFDVVKGAEGPSPRPVDPPPPGTVLLAHVWMSGGSASIDPAWVTDMRPTGLAVPRAVVEVSGIRRLNQAQNTSTAWQFVNLNMTDYLAGGMLDAGTGLQVPSDGHYIVHGQVVGTGSGGDGWIQCSLVRNGGGLVASPIVESPFASLGASVSTIANCAAGANLQMNVLAHAAYGLSVGQCFLYVYKITP